MSSETTKKRKVDACADEGGGGGGDASMQKIMAEMKAQMESRFDAMQNEMDELKRNCQSLEASISDANQKCRFLEG